MDEEGVKFFFKRQAELLGCCFRLPQIGIKHTNLLWKNSDRILASLQESKILY